MPRWIPIENQDQHLILFGLGPLSSMYWVLRPDAVCLIDFRKVWSMMQDRPFLWKSHWKQFIWAHKLDGVGSQEIIKVRQKCDPGWWTLRYGAHLPVLWEKSQKRNNGLCQHFHVVESCAPHQVLALVARQFSFSLYVAGAFWAAVPVLKFWENELSKSVHRPLNRNCLGL